MAAPGSAAGIIVMGFNDHHHCLDGWFARQVDGRVGMCYRFTGAEAFFRVTVAPGARVLRLLAGGPAPLVGPMGVSLCFGGRRIGHLPSAVTTDRYGFVDFPLGELAPSATGNDSAREMTFSIRNEAEIRDDGGSPRYESRLFTPDSYLHNGDHRPMGVTVAAIRVF
jgi:hypothetical protein